MRIDEMDTLREEIPKIEDIVEKLSVAWDISKELPVLRVLLQNMAAYCSTKDINSHLTLSLLQLNSNNTKYQNCRVALEAICKHKQYHTTAYIMDLLESAEFFAYHNQ